MSEPIEIAVEGDQARIYGDQLTLFCECDVPSPIVHPSDSTGDECADCRKPLAQ